MEMSFSLVPIVAYRYLCYLWLEIGLGERKRWGLLWILTPFVGSLGDPYLREVLTFATKAHFQSLQRMLCILKYCQITQVRFKFKSRSKADMGKDH